MTKERFTHVSGLLLAAVIGALGEINSNTHAQWAAITIALLTNLRAIIAPPATNGKPPAPPAAPPLALLALFFLPLLGGCNCAGKPPTTGPGPVIATAVDCAEKATHEAALGILDDVGSDLLSADYSRLLDDLIKALRSDGVLVADAAVTCAVQEVGNGARANATRTHDDLEAMKSQRASAWIAARGPTK